MDQFLERYPPTPEVMKERQTEEPLQDTAGAISPRRRPVEGTLDLHGFTVQEAGEQLDRFIADALAQGVTKVLIIHGKGTHRESGGIIREFVRKYLEKNRNIGATGVPSIREGGTGATWAMIRQRSR